MTSAPVLDLTTPLAKLGEAFEQDSDHWSLRETLTDFSYNPTNLTAAIFARIGDDVLGSLATTYGAALSCTFRVRARHVLTIENGVVTGTVASATTEAGALAVECELVLDKEKLIANRFPPQAGQRVHLFLFPRALERYLGCSLGELEQNLWGDDRAARVILLVSGRNVRLIGNSFSVLGGTYLSNVPAEVAGMNPDPAVLEAAYKACEGRRRWQNEWVSHLTPLHLITDDSAATADPIVHALRIHLVNLIALYIAERVAEHGDTALEATFATSSRSTNVLLANAVVPADVAKATLWQMQTAGAAPANLHSLTEVYRSAYGDRWLADRIAIVQVVVTQLLEQVEEAERYVHLLSHAPALQRAFTWNWNAYLDDKVKTYNEQARALDDYVATTVQSVSDQITAMVKSITDAMLAAVVAVTGAFIGALLKDKFSIVVFRLAMATYGVYVLVFAFGYAMFHHYQRFDVLMKDFKARQERFSQRIAQDRLTEIIGNRITGAKRRFRWWFVATSIFFVVLFGFTVGAFCSAERIQKELATPTPTPSPAATATQGP